MPLSTATNLVGCHCNLRAGRLAFSTTATLPAQTTSLATCQVSTPALSATRLRDSSGGRATATRETWALPPITNRTSSPLSSSSAFSAYSMPPVMLVLFAQSSYPRGRERESESVCLVSVSERGRERARERERERERERAVYVYVPFLSCLRCRWFNRNLATKRFASPNAKFVTASLGEYPPPIALTILLLHAAALKCMYRWLLQGVGFASIVRSRSPPSRTSHVVKCCHRK